MKLLNYFLFLVFLSFSLFFQCLRGMIDENFHPFCNYGRKVRVKDPLLELTCCKKRQKKGFASFFSGGFITAIVINPPEKNWQNASLCSVLYHPPKKGKK